MEKGSTDTLPLTIEEYKAGNLAEKQSPDHVVYLAFLPSWMRYLLTQQHVIGIEKVRDLITLES